MIIRMNFSHYIHCLISDNKYSSKYIATIQLSFRISQAVESFLEYTMYIGSERPGLGDISTAYTKK